MDLAVAAIIKAENLDATDEEVEAEFQKMSEQYGMDVEMVKKYLQPDQVKDQVISQKAVAIVVDNATATKPEKTAKKTTKKAEKEADGEAKEAKKTAKKAEKEADGAAKEAKKTAKKTTKKAEKEAEKETE
jgi:trigger factor